MSEEEGASPLDIIDPHHHLWDLENLHYPWLAEPEEHIVGDYSAIRKSYFLADFRADAANQELKRSVHLEAASDPGAAVDETAWLQAVADDPSSGGFPHGIVAYADLGADDAEDTLERHCRHANMRGIRQMLNYGAEPRLRVAGRGDLMGDDGWRAGFALLKTYGLSFDLQIWPWQMEDAASLAGDFPDIQIILNHAGSPIETDDAGHARWRLGMARLAQAPNVAVKISGLGMFDRYWTTESIRPVVLETIESFGADRAMFASNFPVDKLMGGYDGIWQSFDAITAAFSEDERRKLFHDNAKRYYRL
jgi:predicted TIM-barrel fold metal-dependent hydrolase